MRISERAEPEVRGSIQRDRCAPGAAVQARRARTANTALLSRSPRVALPRWPVAKARSRRSRIMWSTIRSCAAASRVRPCTLSLASCSPQRGRLIGNVRQLRIETAARETLQRQAHVKSFNAGKQLGAIKKPSSLAERRDQDTPDLLRRALIARGVTTTIIASTTASCLYFQMTPSERFHAHFHAFMDPMFESIKDEPAIIQAFITTIWFLSVIPVVAFPYAVVLSAFDLSMEVAAGIVPTVVGHKLLFNSKWEPAWSRAMEHLGRLAPFLLLLIPAVLYGDLSGLVGRPVAPAVVPQVEKESKRTLLGEDAGEVALGRLMGRLCLLGLVIGGFINPLLFPLALAFYPLYFLVCEPWPWPTGRFSSR